MKKMFKYASLLFVSGALLVTSCGKKSDETVTPTEETVSSGTDVCQSDKKTTYVLIDASTNSGAASYTKQYECAVSASAGTDTIVLDIKAQKDMDYIYITKSEDGGTPTAFQPTTDLTTGNGKTVKAGGIGGEYSYAIAPGVNSISAFIVKIPMSVRPSGLVSDVYTIWMTNGKGTFNSTGKRTVVGPLTVSLKYGSGIPIISGSGISMGTQTQTAASYISTTGSVNAVFGKDLADSLTDATEKKIALNGTDINFVSLNQAGTALASDTAWFISVGNRQSVGFTGNIEGTNISKFANYTGTTTFTNIDGATLTNLSSPSATSIKVGNGTYVFLTQDGRKGVIQLTNFTKSGSGFNATAAVKVLVK